MCSWQKRRGNSGVLLCVQPNLLFMNPRTEHGSAEIPLDYLLSKGRHSIILEGLSSVLSILPEGFNFSKGLQNFRSRSVLPAHNTFFKNDSPAEGLIRLSSIRSVPPHMIATSVSMSLHPGTRLKWCWMMGRIPGTETYTTSERHPQAHLRDIVDNLATAVVARQHLSLGLHHAIVHSLLVWVLGSDASLVPSRSVALRGCMRLRISTCDCVLIADVAKRTPSKSDYTRENQKSDIKMESIPIIRL